jgi:hypothetical protein
MACLDDKKERLTTIRKIGKKACLQELRRIPKESGFSCKQDHHED